MSEASSETPSGPLETILAAVEHERRREDTRTLDALFRTVTGWNPKLWRGDMLGYGSYHYRYASGREGDFLATGFSPRKANLSVHILPGYTDHSAILDRLGKHKTGRSCVYINTLADIDIDVLGELIRAGLDDLGKTYPVTPT